MSHSPVSSLVPSQEASPDSETKKDSQSPVAVPSLASSLEEVENRALSCVASLHLPLLPPCLTRQEILYLLQNYRKVCKELKEQMAMLLLLTDLISTSISQPCLQDLFPNTTSDKARSTLLKKLGWEWAKVFSSIPAPGGVFGSIRPTKENVVGLHSALSRSHALLPAGDPVLTNSRGGRESDLFFRSYGLPPLCAGGSGTTQYGSPIMVPTKPRRTNLLSFFKNNKENAQNSSVAAPLLDYKDGTDSHKKLVYTSSPVAKFSNFIRGDRAVKQPSEETLEDYSSRLEKHTRDLSSVNDDSLMKYLEDPFEKSTSDDEVPLVKYSRNSFKKSSSSHDESPFKKFSKSEFVTQDSKDTQETVKKMCDEENNQASSSCFKPLPFEWFPKTHPHKNAVPILTKTPALGDGGDATFSSSIPFSPIKKSFEQQVKEVLQAAWDEEATSNCSCDDCKFTKHSHVSSMFLLGIKNHNCHVCRRHRAGLAAMEQQLALCVCLSCTSTRKSLETHGPFCPCSSHHCAGRRSLHGVKMGREEVKSLASLLQREDWKQLTGIELNQQMEENRKAEEALNKRKRLEMLEVSKKKDEAGLKKKVEEVKSMFKQEDEETRRFMEEARWKKMEGGVVDLTREPSTSSGCGCDDCRFVTKTHMARMMSSKVTCRCHPCALDRKKEKIADL